MTSGHHRHSVDQRVDVIATVAAAAAAAATTCVACGGDTGPDFLLRFAPHPRGFDIRPVQSTLPSLNCTQRLSLARKSKVQKGGKHWRDDGEKARARASEHKKETLPPHTRTHGPRASCHMSVLAQTRLVQPAVVCEGAPARCRCALCVGHGGYHASRPRRQSGISFTLPAIGEHVCGRWFSYPRRASS